MPETWPSPATKILILASLLALSLFATIFGFTSGETTRKKIVAFASDSAVTTGIVTNWQITNVSRSPEYWLDVSFKTPDGATHNVSADVGEFLFQRHDRIGDTVPVTYVRSRPEWFYVADEIPGEKQAVALDWLFRAGAVASVLSAIGLVAKLFGNGGTPSHGSPGMPQPTWEPPRPRQRTAGFGKRM